MPPTRLRPQGLGEIRTLADDELLEAVRNENIAMYAELYVRHVGAAYNLARQLGRSAVEADDLVAESFKKVLDALLAGRGPGSAFRAYLLTTLRHTAYDKTKKEWRVDLTEDAEVIADSVNLSVQDRDTVTSKFEQGLAATAFNQLPERWQTVLWLTEIEGKAPADAALTLGLTANGASALAYRAREGLRQAYLQAHLLEAQRVRCQPTIERLGAWARSGLSRREAQQVDDHLASCVSCRELSGELAEINTTFRAHTAAAPSHARMPNSHQQPRKCQSSRDARQGHIDSRAKS